MFVEICYKKLKSHAHVMGQFNISSNSSVVFVLHEIPARTQLP